MGKGQASRNRSNSERFKFIPEYFCPPNQASCLDLQLRFLKSSVAGDFKKRNCGVHISYKHYLGWYKQLFTLVALIQTDWIRFVSGYDFTTRRNLMALGFSL
jgi:hypothetical protein